MQNAAGDESVDMSNRQQALVVLGAPAGQNQGPLLPVLCLKCLDCDRLEKARQRDDRNSLFAV
jgi:hypothetical protein